MNDIDQSQPEPEAAQMTEAAAPEEAAPVFTYHSDGRIELHRQGFTRIELQGVLLNLAMIISVNALRDSDKLAEFERELAAHRQPPRQGQG
jgi:hypothetical protein